MARRRELEKYGYHALRVGGALPLRPVVGVGTTRHTARRSVEILDAKVCIHKNTEDAAQVSRQVEAGKELQRQSG